MFYEEVQPRSADTVSALAVAYGYKVTDWPRIWNDPRNARLVGERVKPEALRLMDVLHVPIPWRITSKSLVARQRGGELIAERDGEPGERLAWAQTVYQHNQPLAGTTAFCVDGCPADDDLPFYWTTDEVGGDPGLRKRFADYSVRNPPTAAQGTTRWRAVLSLAVATGRRVTIWNSLVWGWDMTPAGRITVVAPRAATETEIAGHLNLLRNGRGTGPQSFSGSGWTFRAATR
jgi:hypothetical protein